MRGLGSGSRHCHCGTSGFRRVFVTGGGSESIVAVAAAAEGSVVVECADSAADLASE